ncbi:apolipoprotein N-acyltransferase [compost metagenome]
MTERMLSLLLLIFSGLALGLAHLLPSPPLAWLGVLLLPLALRHRRPEVWGCAGLFLGCAVAFWVGHPWHLGTIRNYILTNQVLVAAVAIAFTTVFATAKFLPVIVAWRLLGRFPMAAWLPVAILTGEWLFSRIFPLPHSDWLVTQATFPPVLRAVSLLGWTLTTWLCLAIAVSIGEAFLKRSPIRLIVPCLGLAGLLALPEIPGVARERLEVLGAVHMTDHAAPPRHGLSGLKLLVWPEQTSKYRPLLSEGAGEGKHLALPLRLPGTTHLYGLVTRQKGSIQNSLIALEPGGAVTWVRAKSRLFPITERPVLGVCFTEMPPPLLPGQVSPRTVLAGFQAVSVVCLEGLERDFLRRAAQDGTELITVSASDRSLVRSPVAMRQIVAVTSLVAADLGLPIVRSSVFGVAAIIDRNGEVLAVSELGSSGILSLRAPTRQAGMPPREPAP